MVKNQLQLFYDNLVFFHSLSAWPLYNAVLFRVKIMGKIPKLKMVMLIFLTHFLYAEWFPSYHSFKSLYLNIILGQTIGVVVV